MAFVRSAVWEKGLPRKARAGDAWQANSVITLQATDSNQVVAVPAIIGGIYRRTGLTVGRTDTTATAVDILAAQEQMDIGDSFMLLVANGSGQVLTVAGGTGVTIAGQSTVAANSNRWFHFLKTAAATITATGL